MDLCAICEERLPEDFEREHPETSLPRYFGKTLCSEDCLEKAKKSWCPNCGHDLTSKED